MNPTIYREIQSGEILKEPIDITHEVTETREWHQGWINWANYHPVAIVSPPSPTDRLANTAHDNGFREACRLVLSMADEFFGDRTLERDRFCMKVSRMYNNKL